jgi:hypothetical protein
VSGDKAIRRTTIAAVAIVAVVAGWVSYRHALTVVSEHGESGLVAKAYPLTIDGVVYAASMVLLNAARQRQRAHWLAYGALALGIAATLAANIAAGVAYGVIGAVVAAWPAPALVISYELLMLVIRSAPAAVAADPVATPSDVVEAAKVSLRATFAAGNPLSVNQLCERFSLTRATATKLRSSVLAESNGHGPG